MKVIKHEKDGKILVEATASAQEVSFAFELAVRGFANKMGIAEVPGKPLGQAVTELLGVADLDSIVAAQAEELLVPMAIDKTGIDPAYQPPAKSSDRIVNGQEHSFSITLTPKPAFELSSYESVEITLPQYTEPQSLVNQQLRQIQESYAEYVPDDPRKVEQGDAMLLALEAVCDGKRIDGLSTEGRTYQMGMGLMPQVFEDALLGMNVGETKTFSIPADEQGNGEIECTVTVKEMQRRVIREIDDSFVASYLPHFPSAEALHNSIRESVLSEHKQRYEDMKVAIATTELAKRFQGAISDDIYEATRDNVVGNLRLQLDQQGIPFDQFVQQQGGPESFGMMAMLQARQVLKEGYALDAFARHEHLEVDDVAVNEVCAGMDPANPAEMRRMMERGGLGYSLREAALRLKAGRLVAERAIVHIDDKETFA